MRIATLLELDPALLDSFSRIELLLHQASDYNYPLSSISNEVHSPNKPESSAPPKQQCPSLIRNCERVLAKCERELQTAISNASIEDDREKREDCVRAAREHDRKVDPKKTRGRRARLEQHLYAKAAPIVKEAE